jgi:hypothetical protein
MAGVFTKSSACISVHQSQEISALSESICYSFKEGLCSRPIEPVNLIKAQSFIIPVKIAII